MRCLPEKKGYRYPPYTGPGRTAVPMHGLLAGRQQGRAPQDRGKPGVGQGNGIPVPQGTLGQATKGGMRCTK
jgi:hypothetical protein